jgi:ComF family protein
MWQELVGLFQAIFYPQRCPQCEKIVEGQVLLCDDCRSKLQKKQLIGKDALDGTHLAGACLLYAYEGGIKKSLHLVKYLRKKQLLPRLAAEVENSVSRQEYERLWPWQEMLVVPIPTEPGRQLTRGYEIPREIFWPWCRKQNLNYLEALVRLPGSKPQYGLNKQERKSNVEASFLVIAPVTGKTILLVDDIFTTGATMEEAAKMLLQAGAHQVWALAFSGGNRMKKRTFL